MNVGNTMVISNDDIVAIKKTAFRKPSATFEREIRPCWEGERAIHHGKQCKYRRYHIYDIASL